MNFDGRARRLFLWEDLPAPRGIKPTDIDGVKLAESARCFFFFEGKTVGVPMLPGQARAYERLLLWGPPGRAVLVIGRHWDLRRDICLPDDIVAIEWWWADAHGRIRAAETAEAGAFAIVYARFFDDADRRGRLAPEAWEHDIDHPAAARLFA
jgi:hypothetical protein